MTRLSSVRRSFPTITMPFRWIGKSRRRIRVASLALLAMIVGPPVWWSVQLLGLPDIGDPFDTRVFRAFTIPEDRNAYVLYAEAARMLQPWNQDGKSARFRINLNPTRGAALPRWSNAIPELREWADQNREALAVYRRGSERPDALDAIPKFNGYHSDLWNMDGALRSLVSLALLEASRLEDSGNMAGAWGWYRAVLRTIHHVGMHGTVYRRTTAQTWHNDLRTRLIDWARDQRTTPAMIRAALDDVVACESLAPSESYLLKAEYLDVDRLLDRPDGPTRSAPASWSVLIPAYDIGLNPEWTESLYGAWRAWRREPQRSRRAMRLAIANWLAYYQTPPEKRPRPDPKRWLTFDFYAFGLEAPANARLLSPRSLAGWLDSSIDANFLFGSWNWTGVRMTDRANYRALLILLGEELYFRDQGVGPPNPEALVGPYLRSLPPEVDDGRDQAIPLSGKPVDESESPDKEQRE
jgi:hypothetical protein